MEQLLISQAHLRVNWTDKDDEIEGLESAERTDGGGGSDTIDGKGGDDQLWGNTGNDVLSGGSGSGQSLWRRR